MSGSKKGSKTKQPAQWEKERRAARAVQVAFDLDEQVQQVIRQEALDLGINASDRIRQILGLELPRRPKRVRLSISLGEADFQTLAERFDLDDEDRISIKQQASEALAEHVQVTQQTDKAARTGKHNKKKAKKEGR